MLVDFIIAAAFQCQDRNIQPGPEYDITDGAVAERLLHVNYSVNVS